MVPQMISVRGFLIPLRSLWPDVLVCYNHHSCCFTSSACPHPAAAPRCPIDANTLHTSNRVREGYREEEHLSFQPLKTDQRALRSPFPTPSPSAAFCGRGGGGFKGRTPLRAAQTRRAATGPTAFLLLAPAHDFTAVTRASARGGGRHGAAAVPYIGGV